MTITETIPMRRNMVAIKMPARGFEKPSRTPMYDSMNSGRVTSEKTTMIILRIGGLLVLKMNVKSIRKTRIRDIDMIILSGMCE